MPLSVLLAVVLVIGLYGLLRWRRARVGGRPRRSISTAGSTASPRAGSRVQPRTQRQLLRLVHGNRAMAQRLVAQVQARYPQHPEQWCWEKAIYDIQRDRRS